MGNDTDALNTDSAPAVVRACAALLAATYLDYAPSDEQREAWRELAWQARREHDRIRAQLDEQQRLLCAYCGKPLSALEFVERRLLRPRIRLGWHHDCADQDELGDSLRRADAAMVGEIVMRGPGRIGRIAHAGSEGGA